MRRSARRVHSASACARRVTSVCRSPRRASTGVPGSGNSRIPADFLQDGQVLKHLPGLITVLRDGGYTDQEVFDWLFRADESLPGTPVEALRGDRHTEVTRRAQALAF